jgi:hypothetical protein
MHSFTTSEQAVVKQHAQICLQEGKFKCFFDLSIRYPFRRRPIKPYRYDFIFPNTPHQLTNEQTNQQTKDQTMVIRANVVMDNNVVNCGPPVQTIFIPYLKKATTTLKPYEVPLFLSSPRLKTFDRNAMDLVLPTISHSSRSDVLKEIFRRRKTSGNMARKMTRTERGVLLEEALKIGERDDDRDSDDEKDTPW